MAGGSEFERHLVFVVVALVVASEAYEDSQLVVGEVGGVLVQRIGMHEHLQALVLSEVEGGVLIDTFRLSCAEVVDHDVECLLVALDELWLGGVLHTRDARRQYVVDRCLVVVLLDVDGADRHVAGVGCAVGEVLRINPPLSPDEVEASESHDDGLLEVGEEHAHEPDRCEVADGTHLLLVPVEWYSELIPCDIVSLPVSQCSASHPAVDDEVVSHDEVFGPDGDVVLVVFLILVEGVVLVDILHVGGGLVGGVVTLAPHIGVGCVALRVVDALVSL